jgi:hypothetical protein
MHSNRYAILKINFFKGISGIKLLHLCQMEYKYIL